MRARRYAIEFGSALGIYTLLLFGSIWAIEVFEPTGPLRTALVLLPMLGVAAGIVAIFRHYQRMDELERRIWLEAHSISFAGTAFATLAWGFLEGDGLPHLSMFVVWPLMATLLLLGLFVARRRYR